MPESAPRLVLVSGPPPLAATPATIPLANPVVLLGRHLECDAKLALGEISRRHCCLVQVDNRWRIRDLDSRNGVRVNGTRVREAPLVHGDEVAIAQVIYRLELTGA